MNSKKELIDEIKEKENELMTNYSPKKWQALRPENTLILDLQTAESEKYAKLMKILDRSEGLVRVTSSYEDLNSYLNQLKRNCNELEAMFAKYEK